MFAQVWIIYQWFFFFYIFIFWFFVKVTSAFIAYKKQQRNSRRKNVCIFHIFDQIKCFKGTVVNRTLTSLHGGSLEITLTVPLTEKSLCYNLNQRIYHCPESTGLVFRENQRRGRLPSLKASILWALEIMNGFCWIKKLPIYGPKSNTSQDLNNISNYMHIAHSQSWITHWTMYIHFKLLRQKN